MEALRKKQEEEEEEKMAVMAWGQMTPSTDTRILDALERPGQLPAHSHFPVI